MKKRSHRSDSSMRGYRARHGSCALCGIHEEDTWGERDIPRLQRSHIIGGPSRKDICWNVLMLCSACHGSQHNSNYYNGDVLWPEITHEMLFAAKKMMGEFDAESLADLWGRTEGYVNELSGTTLPEAIMKERRKWN